jgi:uncharacterized protein YdaT
MPWEAKDAGRHTHNKNVNPAKWAAIANSILKRTGDEGQAIRVANSKGKKKK